MNCVCGAAPSGKDLGIEVQGVWDGILIWECGSCHKLRPRFEEIDKRWRIATEIIQRWERNEVGE